MAKKQTMQVESVKTKWNLNKKIIATVLFLFSYGLLLVASLSRDAIGKAVENIPFLNLLLPLPNILEKEFWYSPANILLPVVGFFFIFLIIDWANDFLKMEIGFSPIFPAIFFILCLAALYIAMFFYLAEITRLTSQQIKFEDFLNNLNSGYWTELKNSAFYLFAIAGILGWLSRYIMEKIDI